MIVNGETNHHVDITDRGFNFGDGHFTTIKIMSGKALLLPLHLARLQHACAVLAINFDNWSALQSAIELQAKTMVQGVLKVTITRGKGGNGYSVTGCSAANWYLQARSIPSHYQEWREAGIELTICSYQQTVTPYFAGLKTLNRLDQVMIKQELDRRQVGDGLVCSTEGFVIETAVANLFWVKNNVVYTPSTHRSGVEGIMKTHIITLLHDLNIEVQEGDYPIAHVLQADEVFISNAVMELVPVNRILAEDIAVDICYQQYHQGDSITTILQAIMSR